MHAHLNLPRSSRCPRPAGGRLVICRVSAPASTSSNWASQASPSNGWVFRHHLSSTTPARYDMMINMLRPSSVPTRWSMVAAPYVHGGMWVTGACPLTAVPSTSPISTSGSASPAKPRKTCAGRQSSLACQWNSHLSCSTSGGIQSCPRIGHL